MDVMIESTVCISGREEGTDKNESPEANVEVPAGLHSFG